MVIKQKCLGNDIERLYGQLRSLAYINLIFASVLKVFSACLILFSEMKV
jgi:hypothetical protein